MHRNRIDNTVVYSPDDIVLFRESPFAAWMERLTLENPDHGILPDSHTATAPQDAAARHDAIAATLRAEGRNVVLIDQKLAEPERQIATVAALHSGADFIVNGQLAVEPLSGSAKLLMRTSGYSDFGDYLYIPCETQTQSRLNSAFRLSFYADLLHGLQGQLPPQMLIISDGADVVPLQTEDHIYYYRAVQERFMQAMQNFRKHRMPDPSESSHFGRWSACASEVLKQRAQRDQSNADASYEEEQPEEVLEMPQLRVASGNASAHSWYDTATEAQPEATEEHANGSSSTMIPVARSSGDSGHTLAEQAQQLAPGSYRSGTAPGHTPNLARFAASRSPAGKLPDQNKDLQRHRSDAMLQNLEFIGSSAPQAPLYSAPSAAAYQEPVAYPESSTYQMPSTDEGLSAYEESSTYEEPSACEGREPPAVPAENKPSVAVTGEPSAALEDEPSAVSLKADPIVSAPKSSTAESSPPSRRPPPPVSLPEPDLELDSELEPSEPNYAASYEITYSEPTPASRTGEKRAPPPSLRETTKREYEKIDRESVADTRGLADLEPPPPFFLPPDLPTGTESGSGSEHRAIRSPGHNKGRLAAESVIDLDGMPAPTLPPLEEVEESEFEPAISASLRPSKGDQTKPPSDDDSLIKGTFSSSLHTSDDVDQY